MESGAYLELTMEPSGLELTIVMTHYTWLSLFISFAFVLFRSSGCDSRRSNATLKDGSLVSSVTSGLISLRLLGPHPC